MGNAIKITKLNSLEAAALPVTPLKILQEERKKILFVTSEFAELVKIGGLGDVSAAIPKALLQHHDVRVILPGYSQVLNSGYPITPIATIEKYAGLPACTLGRMDFKSGMVIYVVLCPGLYERAGTPYTDQNGKDWSDNHIRFARLGLAAADIALGAPDAGWQPDLVHANDWPAALTPAYMKWRGQETPSVFTIHNLAHQGLCAFGCSNDLGLPAEVFGMESMEFYGKLSFLKAGITYSHHVTTVSETYAREITTRDFGCGLEGLLKYKFDQGLLTGITNGIDESWEPGSDPHLVEGFAARRWQGRRSNTRHVEKMFGLESDSGPLFAVVSRLVQQKGIDLTMSIASDLVTAGGRLAIMGCGEPGIQNELLALEKAHPGRIGVHIGFNESDARRLFAGSDFLLMPSRFEPCGLSQMYAQRFGSLPIARRTGGLADTIENGLSGFLFDEATSTSYFAAIQRALNVYKSPDLLNAMRCRAMASPLYWQQSVQPYNQLYKQLLK